MSQTLVRSKQPLSCMLRPQHLRDFLGDIGEFPESPLFPRMRGRLARPPAAHSPRRRSHNPGYLILRETDRFGKRTGAAGQGGNHSSPFRGRNAATLYYQTFHQTSQWTYRSEQITRPGGGTANPTLAGRTRPEGPERPSAATSACARCDAAAGTAPARPTTAPTAGGHHQTSLHPSLRTAAIHCVLPHREGSRRYPPASWAIAAWMWWSSTNGAFCASRSFAARSSTADRDMPAGGSVVHAVSSTSTPLGSSRKINRS